jgi:outer membrane biogenesis lipoprotein LolB
VKKIWLLPLILIITSCTGQLPAVKENIVAEKKVQPQVLLEKINTYNQKVSNLKGDALLVYRDGEHTLSFRTAVISRNQLESIRMDLYDFVFKTPIVSMVKRGNEIFAVLYTKKQYFSTTVDALDFKQVLGFDVPVELLFHSLLAKVYVPDREYEAEQIDDYNLELREPGITQRITFDEDLIPVSVLYTFMDDEYNVKFEKYNRINDIEFPLKITLTDRERVLELNYSNVTLNAGVSEETFLLEDIITEDFTEAD